MGRIGSVSADAILSGVDNVVPLAIIVPIPDALE